MGAYQVTWESAPPKRKVREGSLYARPRLFCVAVIFFWIMTVWKGSA